MSARTTVTVDELIEQPASAPVLLDARSPAEFAHDHLPAAENWPVLDDAERARVGTLHATSPFDARALGAVLVARNIATLIEQHALHAPRAWAPVVYCWRGGQRSSSLAHVLAQIGWRARQLEGGYKAFRAAVRTQLETLPNERHWRVLCGRTGSGKTRLLEALQREGAQVLDLEALAAHRGSVLGGLAGRPQPSQKRFETLIWDALRRFDATRPVFVESESARIGRLRVPASLLQAMHANGEVLRVETPDAVRLALLLDEYAAAPDAQALCALLDPLVEQRGRARVAKWQALARAGHWPALAEALMHEHYDPLYAQSMRRSYAGFEAARGVPLAGTDDATLAAVARTLMAEPLALDRRQPRAASATAG